VEQINIQPVYDKVLVEVEAEWQTEHLTKSGVIGIAFENDIDRLGGAVRNGRVIAVPRGISAHYFLSFVQESPQIGDILYFHFNAILPDNKIDLNIYGKPYYLIHMENIFAMVRGGEVIMYGGRVLAEPIFDGDVEDLGGLKVRKTKGGIISELNVGHNLKKATLTHIGNPLKNDTKTDVAPGDTIFYDKDADFENEIEGKKYFCMVQEDILMKEV
jgi:co-chaperonin GroES (HSP10)